MIFLVICLWKSRELVIFGPSISYRLWQATDMLIFGFLEEQQQSVTTFVVNQRYLYKLS